MSFFSLYTILALLLAAGKWASAQNCGCATNLCCSQFGYCGTGDPYCGEGCLSGPCDGSTPSDPGVDSIVTDAFVNGIANRAPSSCPGRGFYTRSSFLEATRSFPQFGTVGGAVVARREIAAFFAHVTYETDNLCYREEINGASRDYCDETNRQWPCVAGKGYYGRGPLQLSYNFNYGSAGRSIGVNLLNNPDIVATDPVISFKTALWFWMIACHAPITSGQGFGATIRAIVGYLEDNGANSNTVTARVNYYNGYCNQLRVDPGAIFPSKMTCYFGKLDL